MREIYESSYHSDPSPLNSSLGLMGGDPFYDRYPWFRLIGRYDTHSQGLTILGNGTRILQVYLL